MCIHITDQYIYFLIGMVIIQIRIVLPRGVFKNLVFFFLGGGAYLIVY
jgi:hypothetical protein